MFILSKDKPKIFNSLKEKTKNNIWSSDKIALKHPAIFPEKLAEKYILS